MRWALGVTTLLVIISPFLLWTDPPISRGAVDPHLRWGVIALGGIIGIAWVRRWATVFVTCSTACLGVCGYSLLHLTWLDPSLWALVDENAQYAQILKFSKRYLPANFGVEPNFQAQLAIETGFDRLTAAIYFMGWGWWLCLAASVLTLIAVLSRIDRRLIIWAGLLLLLHSLGLGWLLFDGLAAQYLQENAHRLLLNGRYAEAIASYEQAQHLSLQCAASEPAYLHLGEAYVHLGMSSHPAARFFAAHRHAQMNALDPAVAEYVLLAQETSSSLQAIVQKRLAWTYVKMGLTEYRQGAIGTAAVLWEQALAVDPVHLQAAYFLSRAYFDQGRYHQSLAMSRFLLGRSSNSLLNAQVQANLGDSYWKLGDFTRARRAYEVSMALDTYANFRIFKSLGGT
jgi:tetratricopeptide (TPR) repeat protein